MTTIDEKKKVLRKKIRELKKQQTSEDKKTASNAIIESVEKQPFFINADTIMVYWSMEDEVLTHEAIKKWHMEKRIILPCVKGDILELREYTGIDSMKEGDFFKILEPQGPLFTELNELDLIIVPGVAFDLHNNRMGRGKAYYDGLLKTTDAYKLGICFDLQLLDYVPADSHDIPMDGIISDKRSTIIL
jgi:5-formyltetrahydrofolate cyclo-ligase